MSASAPSTTTTLRSRRGNANSAAAPSSSQPIYSYTAMGAANETKEVEPPLAPSSSSSSQPPININSISNINSNSSTTTVSFAAAGWLQVYHLGVVKAMVASGYLTEEAVYGDLFKDDDDGEENGDDAEEGSGVSGEGANNKNRASPSSSPSMRFCGSSSGALAAAAAAIAAPLPLVDDMADFAMHCAEHYRESKWHMFCIRDYLQASVRKFGLEALLRYKRMLSERRSKEAQQSEETRDEGAVGYGGIGETSENGISSTQTKEERTANNSSNNKKGKNKKKRKLPKNAYLYPLQNGRLEVFLTSLPRLRSNIVTSFPNLNAVEAAICATCCLSPVAGLPMYWGPSGQWVVDGGIAAFQPREGELLHSDEQSELARMRRRLEALERSEARLERIVSGGAGDNGSNGTGRVLPPRRQPQSASEDGDVSGVGQTNGDGCGDGTSPSRGSASFCSALSSSPASSSPSPSSMRTAEAIALRREVEALDKRLAAHAFISVSAFYFTSAAIKPSQLLPVWWAIYPPSRPKQQFAYDLGYNDCLSYLIRNGLVADVDKAVGLLIPTDKLGIRLANANAATMNAHHSNGSSTPSMSGVGSPVSPTQSFPNDMVGDGSISASQPPPPAAARRSRRAQAQAAVTRFTRGQFAIAKDIIVAFIFIGVLRPIAMLFIYVELVTMVLWTLLSGFWYFLKSALKLRRIFAFVVGRKLGSRADRERRQRMAEEAARQREKARAAEELRREERRNKKKQHRKPKVGENDDGPANRFNSGYSDDDGGDASSSSDEWEVAYGGVDDSLAVDHLLSTDPDADPSTYSYYYGSYDTNFFRDVYHHGALSTIIDNIRNIASLRQFLRLLFNTSLIPFNEVRLVARSRFYRVFQPLVFEGNRPMFKWQWYQQMMNKARESAAAARRSATLRRGRRGAAANGNATLAADQFAQQGNGNDGNADGMGSTATTALPPTSSAAATNPSSISKVRHRSGSAFLIGQSYASTIQFNPKALAVGSASASAATICGSHSNGTMMRKASARRLSTSSLTSPLASSSSALRGSGGSGVGATAVVSEEEAKLLAALDDVLGGGAVGVGGSAPPLPPPTTTTTTSAAASAAGSRSSSVPAEAPPPSFSSGGAGPVLDGGGQSMGVGAARNGGDGQPKYTCSVGGDDSALESSSPFSSEEDNEESLYLRASGGDPIAADPSTARHGTASGSTRGKGRRGGGRGRRSSLTSPMAGGGGGGAASSEGQSASASAATASSSQQQHQQRRFVVDAYMANRGKDNFDYARDVADGITQADRDAINKGLYTRAEAVVMAAERRRRVEEERSSRLLQ